MPRNVGKASEIGDNRELCAAGGDALVAARPRDEPFALGNGAHRRFQEVQGGYGICQAMRQNFRDAPSFVTNRSRTSR